MHAQPKPTGLLVGGFNPVAVDLACIRMMGYDYHKIPLMMGVERMVRPLVFESGVDRLWESLQVSSNLEPIRHLTNTREMFNCFEPCQGWKGHIELKINS